MTDSDAPLPHAYRFGAFTLEPAAGALSRHGQALEASPKMIHLLRLLLDTAGEVVGKYDLIDQLWPGQEVSEWSLSRLVSDTRRVLGDAARDQGLIQTVHGRGFRINPAVTVEVDHSPPPALPASKAEPPAAAAVPLAAGSPDTLPPDPERARDRTRVLRLGAGVLALAAALAGVLYLATGAPGAPPRQLVVLPVDVATGDPQDAWVEYGVMTALSGQLQRFAELRVSDVRSTVQALGEIEYRSESTRGNLFARVCEPLGCDRLVHLKLTLNAEGTPVLTYTLLTATERSPEYNFEGADVLQTSGLLFEHLLQRLLPPQAERVQLEGMYTDDPIANQNFALGANSLMKAEFDSAQRYLDMALEQKPDFFWANAFMADVLVRSTDYMAARSTLDRLSAYTTDPRRRLYLEKVYSDLDYNMGALKASIEHSETMLALATELDDPEARGIALMQAGTAWQSLGDNHKAQQGLRDALQVFRAAGLKLREAQAVFNLGNSHFALSELDQAEAYYRQAADSFRVLGARRHLLFPHHALATLSVQRGRLKQAESQFLSLEHLAREMGETEQVLLTGTELANIDMHRGDYNKAVQRLLAVYDAAGEAYTYARSWASGLLIVCYLNLGDVERAQPFVDERRKYDWFDARVPTVFVEPAFEHASGEFGRALDLARVLKDRLGAQWTDQHEAWLAAFQEAARSEQPAIRDYFQFPG